MPEVINNTIAIHRTSRHPHQQKLRIFNSLIYRLTKLPITTNSFKEPCPRLEIKLGNVIT